LINNLAVIIVTHILNPLSFFNSLEIDKTPGMNLVQTIPETKSLSVLIYHTHEENPNPGKRIHTIAVNLSVLISIQFLLFDQHPSHHHHHHHPHPYSTFFLR
jgi:hypothetical protein